MFSFLHTSHRSLQFLLFFALTTISLGEWGCAGEGVPKSCISDDICGLGRICVAQRCIEGCRKQSDCLDGQVCFENRCGKQVCKAGQQIPCYDGSDRTKATGICREGTKFCLYDGTEWSACVQQLLPQQEVCDQADNDCDGQIDEGLSCECTPGSRRACYHGSPETLQQGTCQAGIQYCENDHRWGKCHGQTLPTSEICDQKDNNCNGMIDEWIVCDCQPGQTRDCYTGPTSTDGIGRCKKGQQSCTQDNRWGACIGEITPQLEENEPCNGKDDDCDGVIDNRSGGSEPLKDFCYEGPRNTLQPGSPCREGIKTCQNGSWGPCIGQHLPQQETCNTIDDDCNGQIDEGCQNQCVQGTTRPCYPASNKGCTLVNNAYTCQGECQAGIQFCQHGQWSACVSARIPQPEECNQKDDDCDGIVDNDCNKYCSNGETRPCYDVQQKGCSASSANPQQPYQCDGECKAGVQICQKNVWGACLFTAVPQKELCDGKDNDCDGAVDEDFPLLQQPCTVGKGICAQTDKYICNPQGTQVMCPAQPNPPGIEICDGKDNDCDGVIDNQCVCVPSCPSGTECKQGQCIPLVVEVSPEIPETTREPSPDISETTTHTEVSTETSPEPNHSGDSGPEIAPEPEPIPEPEIGPLPEGYVCYPGQTLSCYTGPSVTQQKGACQDGTQTCQTNGQWGQCVGQTLPVQEICDGLDNDCDGQVDELPELQGPLCSQNGNVCSPGNSCTQKPGVCKGATAQCLGILGWAKQCTATDYQRHSADYQDVEDRCDTLDNDCDGQIDENCPWAVGNTGSLSSARSVGQAVAIDAQGNLYVAGYFKGALVLGKTTLQSTGDTSIFVTKINPAGQFVWTLRAGGSVGEHQATSITVDAQGNLLVGGYFYGQSTFGSITLQSFASQTTPNYDGFVAKLSQQGQFVWAIRIGGLYNDYVRAVAVDAQSNVYAGGTFEGAMIFATNTLQTVGSTNRDAFVAKLSTTGQEIWAASGGSFFKEDLFDIKLHPKGGLYVTGSYAGKGTFGTLSAPDQNSSANVYVGKIDQTTGKWSAFVYGVGAGKISVGKSILINSKTDDIFVTGYFRDSVAFGSYTLSSKGRDDIFVIRLDQQGQFLWAVSYGGSWDEYGQGLSMDKQGNLVLTGYFDSSLLSFGSLSVLNVLSRGGQDIFLASLQASDGTVISVKSTGGGSNDQALGIVVDLFDNFYITGTTAGSASFGPHLLSGGVFLWQTPKP